MIGGGGGPAPPPAALTPVTFTSYLGRTVRVAPVLDASRTYSAAVPRGDGTEAMVAVRYTDDEGALPIPMCVVYAARSLGVRGVLDALARAAVAYYFTTERPSPETPVGILWPFSARALYLIQHGDNLGNRMRGAAGFVRVIRPADYATAAFWVEPNGVKPLPPS